MAKVVAFFPLYLQGLLMKAEYQAKGYPQYERVTGEACNFVLCTPNITCHNSV